MRKLTPASLRGFQNIMKLGVYVRTHKNDGQRSGKYTSLQCLEQVTFLQPVNTNKSFYVLRKSRGVGMQRRLAFKDQDISFWITSVNLLEKRSFAW
jgi:hypothetical protein